jgi:uncharacterized membrane protein
MFVVAILFIILLLALLWWARKSIFGWMSQTEDITGSGFTLTQLRELHKNGKMTQEEFDRAKAMIVEGYNAAAKKAAATEKTAASGSQPPPPRA